MFGKIRNASVTASPSKATCSSKLCDVCQAGKQHESRRLIKKQLQSLICLILRVWILTLHEGMQQQEVTTFRIWLWQIRFAPGTLGFWHPKSSAIRSKTRVNTKSVLVCIQYRAAVRLLELGDGIFLTSLSTSASTAASSSYYHHHDAAISLPVSLEHWLR